MRSPARWPGRRLTANQVTHRSDRTSCLLNASILSHLQAIDPVGAVLHSWESISRGVGEGLLCSGRQAAAPGGPSTPALCLRTGDALRANEGGNQGVRLIASGAAIHVLPLPDVADLKEKFDSRPRRAWGRGVRCPGRFLASMRSSSDLRLLPHDRVDPGLEREDFQGSRRAAGSTR
jgi:hypothetical protein